MTEEFRINIRKFRLEDRQSVRDIVYDAAFMGKSADIFFEGREIISDALTVYFTDYEPQSCFVAEVEGKVVGCLIGAKDKARAEKTTGSKIGQGLLRDALLSGALFKNKNIVFLSRVISSSLKGEFKAPDFNREYPAALHINIREGFRGLNIGSGLVEAYLNYLKGQDVPGVHLATMSDEAGAFFARQGFSLLYSGKRSYFRHILGHDVPLYVYGKRL